MIKKILLIFAGISYIITSVAQNSSANKNDLSPIDVLHYSINLQLDWQKKQATGNVSISLVFTEPTKSFKLAANNLLIQSIYTDNKQITTFNYDTARNNLILVLDKKYSTGENLQLTITYSTQYTNESDPNSLGGSFGKGIRFFQPTVTNPIKRKQAWSQSELQYASYWFPCNPSFSDLSTTEFIATVDKSLTVISNGTLIDKKDNNNQTHSFHYKTAIAHPTYLNAFAIGEYVDHVQYYKNIPLHTFCYPDEKDAATATTVRLPDMMRFLTEKTGFAYPFKNYSQVMVQDYPFPSLTGQNTFSIISDNMIDDYGTHQDYQYLWDGVEFNALASQWFGNIIIPKNIEDIWLSKSFAQFFEGLYVTEKHSPAEYLLWYNTFETGSIFSDWNNGNRHPIVPGNVSNAESFAGDNYAKYRGALVLRMLQKEMGNTGFYKSIQYFIKKNAFKPVTTADLQKAIYEATGKDMKDFFDQWIYKTGHPVLQVNKTYDSSLKKLTIKIKQIQQPDPSVASSDQNLFFKGKLTIEIDNNYKEVWIEPKEETTLSINTVKSPKLVNIDAENIWIKEIQFTKNQEEWLYQFLHSKDALARSNAMQQLVQTVKQEDIKEADKNTIIKAFRDVIESETYWRTRFNVLNQLRSIQPLPYDKVTINMLISVIKNNSTWVKAAALSSLGMTKDSLYTDLYISCLNDASDRVVSAAAIALGKTKSSKAFAALLNLKNRPSWKNQSLMHALSGFAILGDVRAENIAVDALSDNRSPRWFLGNGWDYPFIAAQTLATLGKTENAYQILLNRFNTAIKENNIDDIFHQVLLLTTLGDPKALDIFGELEMKYKNDANVMLAVNAFKEQLQSATAATKK